MRYLIIFLLFPLASAAQQKILIDTTGNHGFIVSGISMTTETQLTNMVDSLKKSKSEWRVPSDKELGQVFKATYNKRTMASTFTQGDCLTSDEHVGRMRGDEFALLMPEYDFNGSERFCQYFLIKDY